MCCANISFVRARNINAALQYNLIGRDIRAEWRCTQAGRRGSPGKGVGRESGARVQISSSPLDRNTAAERDRVVIPL